jgi:YVTN family beta-propeller protein
MLNIWGDMMLPDMRNIIISTSTGEDKIIFLSRNSYEKVGEIKLTLPNGGCSYNYFGPHGIALDMNRKFIYTANSYNGSISIIDMIMDKITESIYVGTSPCHVSLCKRSNMLYTSNYDSDTISGIDLNKKIVAVQIPVNRMPHYLEATNDGKKLYVSSMGSESLIEIDTDSNNVTKEIDIGCNATHFYLTKNNDYIYAVGSKFDSDNKGMICVIDLKLQKSVELYKVGMYLSDIACKESNQEMLVTDAETSYIYKIDIKDGKLIGKANTFKLPSCINMDNEKNKVIVSTQFDDILQIFNFNDLRLLKSVSIGKDINSLNFFK